MPDESQDEGQLGSAAEELPEALRALEAKALAAGLTVQPTRGWDDEPVVRIGYPMGRSQRFVAYDEGDAQPLALIDLSAVRFLPELQGIIDVSTGTIEVQIRTRNSNLMRVPGFENLSPVDSAEQAEDELVFGGSMPRSWRLLVQHETVEIELSPASEEFRAIRALGNPFVVAPTLKLRGLSHASTEESMDSLTTLSDSLFFDLDVRYGLVVELMRAPERAIPLRRRRVNQPPRFPENRYLTQPTVLYRYGRSAQGLPLLSFLAFYQVLEFFFPIFTQEEVNQRARQTLRNPTFDLTDDVSILRLIEAIRPSMKFGVSEKEQLRATVRHCMDAPLIREFVTSSEDMEDHFCKRQQTVPGLGPLKLEASTQDLRDQVADRIYDIRCRIVHTKSDGGDTGVELLLPTGPAARSLAPDIELARLAAQEAIIAGASPLNFR